MTVTLSSVTKQEIYTSKIIKASALLTDTKLLLSHWNENLTVAENLNKSRTENIFGKASRSRIEDILSIFRQRYLELEPSRKALVYLAKAQISADIFDKLLYFYSVRSDALLYDVVTTVINPLRETGRIEITVSDVRNAVTQWVSEGKTVSRWSDNTITRVVRNVMSSLRDFGILQGAVKKRIASNYLPLEAFVYIAFYLNQLQPSGERLLHHPDWQLFFLTVPNVERLFIEAHQHHLLEYYAAGSIIRIDFPTKSLEEYARVIVERTL